MPGTSHESCRTQGCSELGTVGRQIPWPDGMFFWFGFGSYSSRLGTTMLACPRCGTATPHELHETGQKLSVFFIPIARFRRRYVLVCQRCGAGQEISAESATQIRQGQPLPSKNPFDLR